MDSNMRPGVFLGYVVDDGFTFKHAYYVAALNEFKGKDLRKSANYTNSQVKIETVNTLVVPRGDITFPLKARYDKMNRTVEGIDGGPEQEEQVTKPERRWTFNLGEPKTAAEIDPATDPSWERMLDKDLDCIKGSEIFQEIWGNDYDEIAAADIFFDAPEDVILPDDELTDKQIKQKDRGERPTKEDEDGSNSSNSIVPQQATTTSNNSNNSHN